MTKEKVDKEKNYSKKIERIKPILMGFALKKIRNRVDAEDVVQNCLIILFKKEALFDSSKSFFNWAFTILNFQIKGFFSQRSRSKEDLVGEVENSSNNAHADYINSRDFLEKKRDQLRLLNLNKDCLSTRESQVLNLTLKGFKQIEISRELKIRSCHVSNYNKNLITKMKSRLSNEVAKTSNHY
jgi:RNA polymerase sigma factor (sigma-70 family)